MIWFKTGMVKLEGNEPCLRSCWECNSAHERLKKVNALHLCFACGRYWIGDTFLNTVGTVEKFVAAMLRMGFREGESTTTTDLWEKEGH